MTRPGLHLALLCLLALALGCSEEQAKKVPLGVDSIEYVDDTAASVDDGHLQVYILPAPLQVATVLQTEKFQYREDLLFPIDQGEGTHVVQSITLGFYLIDLGYTAVYNERQRSIQYLRQVKELMGQLGIVGMVENEMIQRFETHLAEPDSLSKIILEAYSMINEHFNLNQQEDMGLLILSGCYLEGLYLTLNSYQQDQPLPLIVKLLDQHETFLKNLLELSDLFVYKGESNILFNAMPGIASDITAVKEHIYNGASQETVKTSLDNLRNRVNRVRNELIR